MQDPARFYLDQAATCGKAADNTPLANQRETFLRAQAAWQALAMRTIDIRRDREQREAEKAERLGEALMGLPGA